MAIGMPAMSNNLSGTCLIMASFTLIGNININDFSTSQWSFGGSVNSDASIFRTPDNPYCLPDQLGLVLLGQFTTTGTLSGYLNLAINFDKSRLDDTYQIFKSHKYLIV